MKCVKRLASTQKVDHEKSTGTHKILQQSSRCVDGSLDYGRPVYIPRLGPVIAKRLDAKLGPFVPFNRYST